MLFICNFIYLLMATFSPVSMFCPNTTDPYVPSPSWFRVMYLFMLIYCHFFMNTRGVNITVLQRCFVDTYLRRWQYLGICLNGYIYEPVKTRVRICTQRISYTICSISDKRKVNCSVCDTMVYYLGTIYSYDVISICTMRHEDTTSYAECGAYRGISLYTKPNTRNQPPAPIRI